MAAKGEEQAPVHPAVTLGSALCSLRLLYPREARHDVQLAALYSAPSTRAYIPSYATHMSVEQAAQLRRSHNKDPLRYTFTILSNSEEYLGTIGLKIEQGRQAELGVLLTDAARGKGTLTQAAFLLISFAFDKLEIDDLWIATSRRNTSMFGWTENVLRLQPVPDTELSQEQKDDRDSWESTGDGLIFYRLHRSAWTAELRQAIKRRIATRNQPK